MHTDSVRGYQRQTYEKEMRAAIELWDQEGRIIRQTEQANLVDQVAKLVVAVE